jgi:hypothetical protein
VDNRVVEECTLEILGIKYKIYIYTSHTTEGNSYKALVYFIQSNTEFVGESELKDSIQQLFTDGENIAREDAKSRIQSLKSV